MGLHGLLHLEPDGGGVHVTLGVPHLVDVGDTRLAGVVRQRADSFTWLGIFGNGLSASTSKDNQVQQTVCSKSVCSMDRATAGLSSSVEARDNLVIAIGIRPIA